MSKFFFHSQYGETLDLALHLQNLGHEVVFFIPSKDYSLLGDGMITKATNWHEFMGQEFTYIFDGCEHGRLQDWLRSKGEKVFGSSERSDRVENERQLNQRWFKAAGFKQPISKNFTEFSSAIKFVETHKDNPWILKQNGDAPKHLNHLGKFSQSEDMLYHLRELSKGWNVQEFGPIDFDLMGVVSGLEIAVSAFFNGQDFLKNEQGKVCGFLNFEEKKEANGATGETCGEMGTTFIAADETHKLFHSILLRPKILDGLRSLKFRGIFDINCIIGDKGITALEPTCRLGVPATSYEFIEGLENPAEVIEAVAKGDEVVPKLTPGIGMVMCIVAKPFPLEADVESEATSQGEKLWVLKSGEPVLDFLPDQRKHIHLYNFHRKLDQDSNEFAYKVATKNGYLLTVTGAGEKISRVRSDLIKYIKNNLYISGMKYRTDIGVRVEQAFAKRKENKNG
jgi:phosphoribosylamine-glycine ligase